ncbi:MAG: 6-bladed beta-propeller [Bacteroides sp.]|nr:6-bladed beta-propeller [Bacteroides sp.]
MKLLVYLLMFSSFFLLSCTNSQNVKPDIQEIIVDVDNMAIENVSAFKQFRFVNLEFGDESMLSDIAKVVCCKNRIYVLSTEEPTVFIFDAMGKYEKKLRKGQGPGEVVFVSDLGVYNDTLYVLDSYRKIKLYDLAGNYIKDKQTFEQPFFSVAFASDGMYLFDPNINKNQIIICISFQKREKIKLFYRKINGLTM